MIEKVLESRRALTIEVDPPSNADLKPLIKNVQSLKHEFDAFNVTELIMRRESDAWMNTFYVAVKLREEGVITIPHMTCREHNRRESISNLLMGISGGVSDVLVIAGDRYGVDEVIMSKEVFEMNTIEMIKLVRGVYQKLSLEATVLVASNPTCNDLEAEVERVIEKLDAGASVIQTQPVYDVETFKEYMELLEEGGHKPLVLVGVLPPRSLKMIEFVESRIGVRVPEAIKSKFEGLSKEECKREGLEVALDVIRRLKTSCSGFHIFPMGNLSTVNNLVSKLKA